MMTRFTPATKNDKGRTTKKLRVIVTCNRHLAGATDVAPAKDIADTWFTAMPAILRFRQTVPIDPSGADVYSALAATRPAAPQPHPDCRPLGSALP
jgi:hypothetical protein